jgi:hypothetical protein
MMGQGANQLMKLIKKGQTRSETIKGQNKVNVEKKPKQEVSI